MHSMPPPYLDPGSGSFIIQFVIAACMFCGTPAAALATILALFRYLGKETKERMGPTDES